MATKQYPLNVFESHEEGHFGLIGYWSKGHHDAEEFLDVVIARYEPIFDVGPVQHTWYRCMPASWDPDSTMLVEASGPGRGVFPATVAEVT